MGWFELENGDMIGDEPADIVDAWKHSIVDVSLVPPEVRARIVVAYRECLDRDPTERELQSLLKFCAGVGSSSHESQ